MVDLMIGVHARLHDYMLTARPRPASEMNAIVFRIEVVPCRRANRLFTPTIASDACLCQRWRLQV